MLTSQGKEAQVFSAETCLPLKRVAGVAKEMHMENPHLTFVNYSGQRYLVISDDGISADEAVDLVMDWEGDDPDPDAEPSCPRTTDGKCHHLDLTCDECDYNPDSPNWDPQLDPVNIEPDDTEPSIEKCHLSPDGWCDYPRVDCDNCPRTNYGQF